MTKRPSEIEKKNPPPGGGARRRRAELVDELLTSMETKLKGKDAKATLADYIRLLQLQKEMDEEMPSEIRVKWVDPEELSES